MAVNQKLGRNALDNYGKLLVLPAFSRKYGKGLMLPGPLQNTANGSPVISSENDA